MTQVAPLAAWLRRRPLRGYVLLAFGLSWGGILLILVATGFDLAPMGPWETGGVAALMLLGPSLAGLVMTMLLEGRAGLRAMLARLRTWRVGLVWYAVALLTVPLLLLGTLGGFGALADPAFAPRFQWWLFAAGLIAGLFEEIGWTGFATPRLLARHRLGRAGLWLGAVWALWHLLVDFRYNAGTMGGAWLLEFAIVYLATLTPYRILMMWVYAKTQSLLLAMLMHASFTGWLLVLDPGTSFAQGLLWQAVFAAMLWLTVALVLTRDAAQPGGSDTR